jgi:ABC-type uncharacterized transport system substrate-binding protein
MMRAWAILGVLIAGAGPVQAHPHVWIDTRIEVVINDRNEATGLWISWTYDDLFSLYILGDMGLDQDWDGKLTPEEEATLAGFDMNWEEGYAGDTHALKGGVDLALSRPKDWSALYAGGKITSTHFRSFDAPIALGAEPLIVQAYDPGYYTAYVIAFDPVLSGGTGCLAEAYAPDLAAADEKMKQALAEFTPDVNLEDEFPAIGRNYAEEVRVTCAAP